MIIAGLQKQSLIDYPGKISCIIFTLGCNFRCPFCYNPSLVIHEQFTENRIKEEEFLDFLESRRGLLDAVVITGGEPTLHKDLGELIKKIKDKNFLVKLDTQGSNPKFLRELLDYGNIDYIAMDIKGPIEKYQEITNSNIDPNSILESIKIIQDYKDKNQKEVNNNFDYEFRTTIVADQIVREDFEKIGEMIKGSPKYYLQAFQNNHTLNNPDFSERKPYSEEEMKDFQKIMQKYVKEVFIR